MRPQVRAARVEDVPALVALMAEFYEEGGYPLPREAAARTFTALLDDPRLGRVWVVEVDHVPTGYVVLTFGFSMEYGGLRGFVDDFFVRSSARGRGLGRVALETVKDTCRELGVRALLVEAAPAGHPARRLYTRAGFGESGRVLLSQALAPPIHEA